jgi:PAS domain S-box-containing protein
MMKLSYKGKIRTIVVILFLISIVQGTIIMQATSGLEGYDIIKQDIQNTIYISWFLQFLLSMILIFYLPIFLTKAFSEIQNKLKEISQGNYSIEMDLSSMQATMDKELFAVLETIKEMLKSVKTFDLLKKEKILEHHHRIKAILSLSKEGFVIVDKKGNIVYVNDLVTEVFPQLEEKVNIVDNNFPPDVENNIKKYVLSILKSESKQEPLQFFNPQLKRHVSMSNAVIRDNNGKVIGSVIAFHNMEKKKVESSSKEESSSK